MGDHHLVADRGHDDPGDDEHVEVGVDVAGKLGPVLGSLEVSGQPIGGAVEVEPPERGAADEGDDEGGDDVEPKPSTSEAVAPVITIDSPRAMITKSWKRSVKCSLATFHVSWPSRFIPGSR